MDGVRVLVVDDDPDARQMLLKVLERAGGKVNLAESAQDALEAIASGEARFDVLVSDLGMPGQDGIDLIREIRRRGYGAEQLPAVALTALAQTSTARDAISAGFQMHVPKPIDVHELVAILTNLAGRTG